MSEKNSVLRIIEDSQEWICVDKPVNWLSVPSRDRDEKRPVVGLILQAQLGYPLFPVHRLDFEVSGLLIFAKNKKMQARLNTEFEKQTAHKVYLAMTTLPMSREMFPEASAHYVTEKVDVEVSTEMEWICLLERGKRRAYETQHGKKSITRASCLGRSDLGVFQSVAGVTPPPYKNVFKNFDGILQKSQCLLWKLQPLTGRSHQLRYEMFRHGCPILGDALYGFPRTNEVALADGIALCHYQITMNTLGTLSLF